jgi:hypothetical protein
MNKTSYEPNAVPLDRLLTDYFQAQMPGEWPAAPHPPAAVASRPHAGHDQWTHRLTLAASVAALLGFGYLLSYGTTDAGPRTPADQGLLNGSTANGEQMKNRLNQTDPMNR